MTRNRCRTEEKQKARMERIMLVLQQRHSALIDIGKEEEEEMKKEKDNVNVNVNVEEEKEEMAEDLRQRLRQQQQQQQWRMMTMKTGGANGNENGKMTTTMKVCVVGAGPAGLVCARELLREGHHVQIYEQNQDVGGQWLYQAQPPPPPPGHDHDQHSQHSHSSIYASLRLRSGRETMGLLHYPFKIVPGRDPRRFPTHRELFLFIKDFAKDFGLLDIVKFNSRVEYIGMLGQPARNVKWLVRSSSTICGSVSENVYDAVVVCTGHYSKPKFPSIPGLKEWPGKQMHSHYYRVPDPFKNKIVLIIGNSHSGQDLSMELLAVAKEVHLASRPHHVTKAVKKLEYAHQNFHVKSEVKSVHKSGQVKFKDGTFIFPDFLFYCTGYSYSLPFLDTKGIVTIEDDRVGPLYEHIFPPMLAPSLSFVGIPRKVIALSFFESQAKWVAQVLSGKIKLPSVEEMMRSVEELYKTMDALGLPKHATHDIANFEYCDKLSDYSGYPHLEEWKKQLCLAALVRSEEDLETFRDSTDDEHLLDTAVASNPEVALCLQT